MKFSANTVLAVCLALTAYAAEPAAVPNVKVETPELVAEVNGDKITKKQLADECLLLYGQTELQDLISKTLIEDECQRKKIQITPAEIDAEIVRTANTFKLSSAEFLQLLEDRRGMSAEEYRLDTVWRVLALSKLAGPRLRISEKEVYEAYESKFGPAIQVRQLVLASKAEADKTVQELRQQPDTFATVVKNRSIDSVSQAYGGLIQPVRRFTLPTAAEQVIFALKPGEISNPVEMFAGQFVIFKCEQPIPAQDVDKQAVWEQLLLKLRESKLRRAAEDVYRELQNAAKIQVIFGTDLMNTAGAAAEQRIGCAAIVNGKAVSRSELAEKCLRKHGKEILNDMISRLVVGQSCRQNNIQITDKDIDEEIREMAVKHLPLKEDGSPDIALWLKRATEESSQTVPVYRTHTVVPVLSLKRLTQKDVQVSEEDVKRSFEANFGKKVRCLAISFGPQEHRRAQEVWEMANKQRTAENFGDLAEKYSTDTETRLARGVIPPIGRYCGVPELEREAFSLKTGEISQIVQSDEALVILYCLEYVEPAITKLDDVKADLIADIFEKKQKIAASVYYESLLEQAQIDNYLTGESRNPQPREAGNTKPIR
ncbi:MAG: peptidylprolyl isomerase [Planctomycetaceae bacterium]|jgi:parvulin-like peptidyl-prolyl isomerase|nr:peptidylprolyl isomerase [Planctomycetaceae bacterium]